MKVLSPLLAVAAAATLLTGCFGPRASFVSNKAPTANLAPKKVFLLSHMADKRAGPNFGEEFAGAFEERADIILRLCGVELGWYRVTGAELDASDLGKRLDAFKPDAVIKVQRTHGTTSAGGYALVAADYDFSMYQDPPAPAAGAKKEAMKTVWRAAVSFKPSDHSFGIRSYRTDGRALADDVLNQLKKDGFFPGCVPTETPAVAGGPAK